MIIFLFEHFFEFQKTVHQAAFSWIPFSAGDIFYILLVLVLFICCIQYFRKKTRNSSFLKLLVIANIFYFIYQIFWGMLYFQTPIIEKLPNHEGPTLNKAKSLALRYLEKCKSTRKLVNEDKNGVFIIIDLQSVENEILLQQQKIPAFISTKKSTRIHSLKPSIFKNVMSYTGILGYYNPFTAEAQYNAGLPSSYIPFTLAHESSHQLGFAREQEANFIGYLVGINSSNSSLRYSTEYFVLKSLLNAIADKDPEFVKSVLNNYSEEMKRDRLYERNFIMKHQGWVDDFFGFTNNLFLKSNQQEGTVTYSYFLDLLLRYER